MSEDPQSATAPAVAGAPDRIARVRRRLVGIQLVAGGLAILLVLIALFVGVAGVGSFGHTTLH